MAKKRDKRRVIIDIETLPPGYYVGILEKMTFNPSMTRIRTELNIDGRGILKQTTRFK